MTSTSTALMKILILKRDKLGDLLLTTPTIQLIRQRYPDAEIHLLASEYSSWVVNDSRSIKKIWAYPRVRTGKKISVSAVLKQCLQILALRKERFDWAIAAGGEYSPRAVSRLKYIGARHTISFMPDGVTDSQITHPVKIQTQGHEALRIAHLLGPLGIAIPPQVDALPSIEFQPSQAMLIEAQQFLSQHHLQPGEYWLLGLGARRQKKQPTSTQIQTWSQAIYDQYGLKTVFMWTPGQSSDPLYPGDDDTAHEVLKICSKDVVIPFRGPLKPAIGLIWGAKTCLFPDSGLMHFASASPGGVTGLFADITQSPNPYQWGPLGVRSSYLIADQSVSQLSDTDVLTAIKAKLISQ